VLIFVREVFVLDAVIEMRRSRENPVHVNAPQIVNDLLVTLLDH